MDLIGKPKTNTVLGGMQTCHIPAGRFMMGGLPDDKYVSEIELPRREVEMPNAFRIMKTPVTERIWETFSKSSNEGRPSTNKPVVNVTLSEIKSFCHWLSGEQPGMSYRLPTETEWEYACRAGTSSIFHWGNSISISNANFLYDEQGIKTGHGSLVEVGLYEPNHFGIVDMSGNVCEWTSSLWTPTHQRSHYDESRRVIRGGAWDQLPRTLRCSWRDWAPLDASYDNLGFRLIQEKIQ